jgi:hypothetical protein
MSNSEQQGWAPAELDWQGVAAAREVCIDLSGTVLRPADFSHISSLLPFLSVHCHFISESIQISYRWYRLNSQRMADSSESTPFLASSDRPDDTNALNDSEDEIPTKTLPANAHFKRPIKILTICVSTASVLGTIFLTASFIIVHLAPFTGYTYNAPYVLQELGTCVSAGNFSLRDRSKLVISKRKGHCWPLSKLRFSSPLSYRPLWSSSSFLSLSAFL